jgi:ATP-dependent DNA ligase
MATAGPASGRCRGGWPTGPGEGGGRASPTWSSTSCGWTAGCSPGSPTPSGGGCWRSWEVAGLAWQTVASFAGAGTALLEATREQGQEGVVAKRLQSIYLPGRRTRNWLKTKHDQRETFLVGGFVPDRDQVRSRLVGLPDPARPDRLRFAGRVDHGLVPAARRRVLELLGPLVTPGSPFAEPEAALLGGRWARPGPDDPAPVFVRPEVAVEVSFLGWESGRLRHPAYAGLTRLL